MAIPKQIFPYNEVAELAKNIVIENMANSSFKFESINIKEVIDLDGEDNGSEFMDVEIVLDVVNLKMVTTRKRDPGSPIGVNAG